MLVKCINNRVEELSVSDEVLAELHRWLPEGKASLTPDAAYVVYAIMVHGSLLWYFVADDDYSGYPFAYSATFFQVVDDRLSRCWRFYHASDHLNNSANEGDALLIAFPEWARDITFYERLVDSDEMAVSEFNRMKSLMDVEFPHPSVTLAATECEGAWLMCPECNEAWESESPYGLVRCPKCNVVIRNPRYSQQEPAGWQGLEALRREVD